MLEDDLNQCIVENKERINDCNLQLRVTPFFDFTSWNIMIEESGSKLYLIDFPKLNYVFPLIWIWPDSGSAWSW